MANTLAQECGRLEALNRELLEALKQIADQAGRASLVQARSVGIIKQVCVIIADDANAAIAKASKGE